MAYAENSIGTAQQQIEQGYFDRLPDELVVKIFSHLIPEDIVSNVARVCTRWQDIAKECKVWETSYLRYTTKQSSQFLQVIKFSPYLAKVEFNWCAPCSEDVAFILSGCSNVKSLVWCPNVEENNQVSLEHFISILNYFKAGLQEVDLYISNVNLPEYPVNDLHMTIFSLLSCMDSLRSLRLRGGVNPSVLHQDIFEQRWRALESVDVHDFNVYVSDSTLLNSSQLFVLHTLKLKAQSLKRLVLSPELFSVNTVGLLYDVCVSSSIETLKICESSLEAVKNLSALKILHVIGLSDISLQAWRNLCTDPQQYQRLFRWIQFTVHFSNLKQLTLENIIDDDRKLIENLLIVCKNVEYLTLCGGNYSSSQLMEIFKNLKRLKKLCIHHVSSFNSSHLKLIPIYLPNLCILDLRCCKFMSAGIFMDYEEEVQKNLPNLKLYTDWGCFDKNGAKLFANANSLFTVAADYAMCNSIQNVSQTLDAERAEVLKMLDEFSDYDEDTNNN